MADSIFHEAQECYFNGDYDESLRLCKIGIVQGRAKCMRLMGWIYYAGKCVELDLEEALEWFSKAAELGDVEAVFGKGAVHYVWEQYSIAFNEFKVADGLGFVPAKVRLGMMVKIGLGADKDLSQAYALYSQAAEEGNLIAARLKVRMLLEGFEGLSGRIKAIPLLIKLTIKGYKVYLENPNDIKVMY